MLQFCLSGKRSHKISKAGFDRIEIKTKTLKKSLHMTKTQINTHCSAQSTH